MGATYFDSPAAFRRWLEKHHTTATELLVGYYKRGTGEPSLTWPESVDEALCFGWIDGVRRRVDDRRYSIRFTPRRPTSIWSAINVARVRELTAAGRMRPSGIAAFEKRKAHRTGVYTYELKDLTLDRKYERELRANRKAWDYFRAQPAWYQRTMSRWVMNAKKEETRLRRLARLIADSAAGRLIGQVKRPGKATP